MIKPVTPHLQLTGTAQRFSVLSAALKPKCRTSPSPLQLLHPAVAAAARRLRLADDQAAGRAHLSRESSTARATATRAAATRAAGWLQPDGRRTRCTRQHAKVAARTVRFRFRKQRRKTAHPISTATREKD